MIAAAREPAPTPCPTPLTGNSEDLHALIGLAGSSAFVHGFSSGATLALLAAEHGLGTAKLSLLEPPLEVAVPRRPPPGISGEVARLIITGRRGDAYERWMKGIGVPAEMIARMRESPLLARPGGHRAYPHLRQLHPRHRSTRPARRHHHPRPRGRQPGQP